MLAAMVVLALVAGTVLTGIGRRPARDGIAATAQAVASRLRATRDEAIRAASEEVAVIDLAESTISSPRESPLQIPSGIAITAIVAGAERATSSRAGIRFFPNGSSTGGTLRFVEDQRSYEVRVNWLSGRISVVAAP